MPVIGMKNGLNLGEVSDIQISGDGQVKGLLVQKGGFLKKTYFLYINDVSSFGSDGVMVYDQSVLQPVKNKNDYTLESDNKLVGKVMMTREGEKLGFLEDVYFQEEVGKIVGYELSDGFFSDMLEGKRVVKTDKPPAIGKDTIIVNVKM